MRSKKVSGEVVSRLVSSVFPSVYRSFDVAFNHMLKNGHAGAALEKPEQMPCLDEFQ